MNRRRGILIAGAFTGLALIVVVALAFGSARATSANSATDTLATSSLAAPATDNLESAQAVEAWRTYSAELEQTVRILQDREVAYQQQIDQANQTILQLQDQINQSNSSAGSFFFRERESEEHEAHEGAASGLGVFDD